MKYVLIIGDGMADNPLPELNGKTPIEESNIPMIDSLAKEGIQGSVLNVPEGFPPGSDTAIMSIFGCDPLQYFTGRSPLEAAGCGFTVEPGCASYRCNMICLEDGDEKPFAEKKILSHKNFIEGKYDTGFVERILQNADKPQKEKK
jgi:2,3-bisphosphoglycerate-independent phosphoglycerate mutase